ncbi:MAG: DNA repair protein RadC [Burkholderiales bacterium]|nr:DNA repair protein RadC [Burkholderiales bacterium]MDE2608983.1 DNA repair protein RadC [Burkholderiales bacterium]
MSISHWPAGERPREKLLSLGAEALSDAELLAILLRIGTAGKSAVALARELLSHFGTLNRLFCATASELNAVRGIGTAKYAQLQAVLEIARRALGEELQGQVSLSSPTAVKHFLRLSLAHKPHEVFFCLYLNTQNQLIRAESLFRGSLQQATVYPREVARQALRHNAAALIVAHNHPSGVARPSEADVRLTRQLGATLELLDIRLLDHFIVGGSDVYSLAEHGEL